ncbi:MAG: M20/M25/M40 family metallo-hydrolase [Oscillospiraceae bacterium]|nr:M20/M25/M40 family metallo-hydrolase [Oscillospiraceae bacterium]
MNKQTAEMIKSYFTEHREEIVADMIRLINVESPSRDKENANRCADELCKLIKERLGIEGKRFPQQNRGDHMVFEWGSGERTVIAVGHYDTVWPIGAKPTEYEGDILKGSGSSDMKCGIVSEIWILKAITDLGLPCDKKVKMFFNSDEELGSMSSKDLILEHGKGCEAAFIFEPAQNGCLKTQRKGLGSFAVEITGKASHAGSAFENGISAINEAAKVIEYLNSLVDLERGTTVSVGIISGGTARNVVAANCRMEVDYRVRTMDDYYSLMEKIKALTPSRDGIKIDITFMSARPPFERTAGTAALYDKLCEVAEVMEAEVAEMASGGGSDGNFLSAAGIATLDGMGTIGGGEHAVTEHINVPKSLERAALICAFLSEM